jgi:catechol 2,3-dioxygenase
VSEPQTEVVQGFSIHPDTRLGEVRLRAANLQSMVAFYRDQLGLAVLSENGGEAALGTPKTGSSGGTTLVHLEHDPKLKHYRRVTGMYHFAVLFPDRRELARAVGRLIAMQYPQSPTDHIMTKTTYLDDPEGNGIELYTESPEDGTWSLANGQYVTRRADGTLSNGREPLDVEGLLANLMKDDRLDAPVPAETRLGHIHLHVGNIEQALDFYHGALGFDVMGHAKAFHMAFVSAGGYHHHIGLNTWQGEGAPPAPEDATGMRYFSVLLPDKDELGRVVGRVKERGFPTEEMDGGVLVRDPSQNGVLLTAAG